ncbi:MAG: metal-dependent hydrolase [Chitinophagales bacterium]|nr:metal-dependent hydrolase [Hyphomicrobiales bacterium]
MANFNTHLAVGAVAAGLGATMTMAAGVVPQNQLLTLTMAGIIGSVLPDIDLEKATPSRMLFSGLGVVFAFIVLFQFKKEYSIAELWAVWIGVYVFVGYGVFAIFHCRTKHRGIFHSILAGAFFAALTATIFDQAFNEDPVVAWFAGLFVFGGYIVHLVLDEIYSVDFEGHTIKRSFGSALKLIEHRSMRATMAMTAAFLIAAIAAPSSERFFSIVSAPNVYSFLQKRMLPEDKWFEMKTEQAEKPPVETEANMLPQLTPMTAPESSANGQMQ